MQPLHLTITLIKNEEKCHLIEQDRYNFQSKKFMKTWYSVIIICIVYVVLALSADYSQLQIHVYLFVKKTGRSGSSNHGITVVNH